MKEVIIYSDGACAGNPGPGGWAALLIYNNHEKIISGHEEQTTNNRMELKAAIEALKLLKETCRVKLYTDSKYVQEGSTTWLHRWKLNNWRRNNILIKNDDLWKEISNQIDKHKIEFIWVKGHASDERNNLVDELARKACKAYKKGVVNES